MAEEKKAREKKHSITAIPGCLPQELINDILLVLPAKSLCQFKSVSKSWNGLISTPSFAKSHLHGIKNHTSLLFIHGTQATVFSLNLKLKDMCDLVHAGVEIAGETTPLPLGSIHVMGSSYGLICIQGSNKLIYVFNPTTKECRNIRFPSLSCSVFGYGFGFVPSIDDYKIVLLTRKASNNRVYVFSLRDDQWRELDGSGTAFGALAVNPFGDFACAGTSLEVEWNVAFYWVVQVHEGFSLLKFDLIKQNFSRGWYLDQNCENSRTRPSIWATKQYDSLCVYQLFSLSSFEMWMLEAEYEDWKLMFKLGLGFDGPQFATPTSNGYVFVRVHDGGGLKIMLVDTNQEPPTCHLVTKKMVTFVASFAPSLISPHYGRQRIVELSPSEAGSLHAARSCHGLIYPQTTDLIHGAKTFNDWNIVLLGRCEEFCNSCCSTDYRVRIFSLWDGQWRELDGSSNAFDAVVDCSYCYEASREVLWNEAFYWIDQLADGFSLLQFDLIKEKFSRGWNLKQNCGDCERMVNIFVTQHNNLCVCQMFIPNCFEMRILELEYGDWKLKLQFEPLFPVEKKLVGSTSNGYVFVKLWNRRKWEVMLVDTNQERRTYYYATDKLVKNNKKIATIGGCLPQELITEVLLRLSIKSPVRFNLVCKTWNNSNSTQCFAKSRVHGIENPASLLFLRVKVVRVRDWIGSSVEIDGNLTTLQSVLVHILESSHGLICILDVNNLSYVFNPITNEGRTIPFPVCDISGHGFGFVPSIDDYKIVLLTQKSSTINLLIILRSHEWPHLGKTQATLWNEAFYWVVPISEGFSSLKFDVFKEKFSRVSNLKRTVDVIAAWLPCVSLNTIACLSVSWRIQILLRYGCWKRNIVTGNLKLRFGIQFPMALLLGSTSDGYALMTLNGRKMQILTLDANQERPTCHRITDEGFTYVADILQVLFPLLIMIARHSTSV
ncbi:hypothetical protein Cgig2_028367 [Carnegiea gigantea]|uniref:F-box domain-containing protein n=1 Tax=Carnegiea gigantea TaxID=171969 RepID=A0A9Q1QBB5_9CARY|nr:hypothetical protein Cgig2_028367 [Carnegiea gigantea]